MDLPRGLSPVSEIPDDCRPEPSRSALIKMICELASSADFVACLLHHLDLRAIDCSEGDSGQRVGRWSGGAEPDDDDADHGRGHARSGRRFAGSPVG
jgi:hypothetical protein